MTSSPADAHTASRRAGAACSTGVMVTSAAPALAPPPAPNRNGSCLRASCQTGTAVLAISAPVYVANGSPMTAAAGRVRRLTRGNSPVNALTNEAAIVALAATRIHEPTLIGEV